ncbi:EF-hand domain-containing protein [Granulicella cerasi]|uniref:EF-hand domain-containing protein n=1 Tax=Granulicella cerasi TaxID=741063 RepID=A0ABW1ZAH8_9BACT|nr:EF-hand domain-containing protein [Granulicella cerasi]
MKRAGAIGLLAAMAAVCAPQAVWAQGPGGGPRMVLKALDTDGDGTLSAAEIAAASKSLLTLDTNGDGQITNDELSKRPENAGASAEDLVKQLMLLDKNGDGVLTADELPARMQNLMERADANKDGKITPDEIRAMARKQGMPAGRTEPGRAGGMFRMDPILAALDLNHDGILEADEIAAAPKSLLTLDKNADGQLTPDEIRVKQMSPEERVNHMIDEWDTNKDGKLSKAEMPDRMQAMFEKIDTNGDGFADKAELLEFYKNNPQMGGRPQQGGEQKPAEEKH